MCLIEEEGWSPCLCVLWLQYQFKSPQASLLVALACCSSYWLKLAFYGSAALFQTVSTGGQSQTIWKYDRQDGYVTLYWLVWFSLRYYQADGTEDVQILLFYLLPLICLKVQIWSLFSTLENFTLRWMSCEILKSMKIRRVSWVNRAAENNWEKTELLKGQ